VRKGYTSKRTWGQDLDIKQEFLKALHGKSRLFSVVSEMDESKVTSQSALIWARSLCLRAPGQASSPD
jgi:hypothetical protein